MVTSDDVVRIGLSLDGVEESLYYGGPALKRGGKVMVTFRDDGETLGVRLDWESHDRLLEEAPLVFYKTDHLEGWPWVYGRLDEMSLETLDEVLRMSWAAAPLKIRNRPK